MVCMCMLFCSRPSVCVCNMHARCMCVCTVVCKVCVTYIYEIHISITFVCMYCMYVCMYVCMYCSRVRRRCACSLRMWWALLGRPPLRSRLGRLTGYLVLVCNVCMCVCMYVAAVRSVADSPCDRKKLQHICCQRLRSQNRYPIHTYIHIYIPCLHTYNMHAHIQSMHTHRDRVHAHIHTKTSYTIHLLLKNHIYVIHT